MCHCQRDSRKTLNRWVAQKNTRQYKIVLKVLFDSMYFKSFTSAGKAYAPLTEVHLRLGSDSDLVEVRNSVFITSYTFMLVQAHSHILTLEDLGSLTPLASTSPTRVGMRSMTPEP